MIGIPVAYVSVVRALGACARRAAGWRPYEPPSQRPKWLRVAVPALRWHAPMALPVPVPAVAAAGFAVARPRDLRAASAWL